MKQNLLKKISRQTFIVTSLLFTISNIVKAQPAVGIGTKTPDVSAALDVVANNKGLLIPRVALQSIYDDATILSPATGLLVYNTNNNIVNGTGAGFYYNSAVPQIPLWIKVGAEIGTPWVIGGNANLNANNHFLGTVDGVDLVFKRDKKEVLRFYTGGNLIATGSITNAALPVSGAGTRMMYLPAGSKGGAFRVGTIDGNQWDEGLIGTSSVAAGNNVKAVGNYSTAFGSGTSSTGLTAFSAGLNSTADGNSAIAMGEGALASGGNSVAIGKSLEASGSNSIALGFNALASNKVAVAIGEGTRATALNATAFGLSTTASGNQSTAFGSGTAASGSQSTTFGQSTSASGVASIAFNSNTKAIGNNSTAFGDGSEALGVNAMAIGKSLASGPNSLAGGTNSTTSGQGTSALAFGSFANAQGIAAVALGDNTFADGNASIAVGNKSYTYGNNSLAAGEGTIAKIRASAVVGMYNVDTTVAGPFVTGGSTKLFVVGNGMDANNRSDAFFVRANGNTTVNGAITIGINGTPINTIINSVQSLDFPSISGANSFLMTGIKVPNAKMGSTVYVSPLSVLNSGIVIAWARVDAPGSVTLTLVNVTNNPIDPALTDFRITVIE